MLLLSMALLSALTATTSLIISELYGNSKGLPVPHRAAPRALLMKVIGFSPGISAETD